MAFNVLKSDCGAATSRAMASSSATRGAPPPPNAPGLCRRSSSTTSGAAPTLSLPSWITPGRLIWPAGTSSSSSSWPSYLLLLSEFSSTAMKTSLPGPDGGLPEVLSSVSRTELVRARCSPLTPGVVILIHFSSVSEPSVSAAAWPVSGWELSCTAMTSC